MRFPRVSIGTIMFATAILCLPLGVVINYGNGHHLLPQDSFGDLGLWPTLMIFGISTRSILRNRGKNSPFLVGFTVTGWTSFVAFLACCFWFPLLTQLPVIYYLELIRDWDVGWINDPEINGLYALNLLFIGLIVAGPQLMMATIGGLISRDIWWNRWTTT